MKLALARFLPIAMAALTISLSALLLPTVLAAQSAADLAEALSPLSADFPSKSVTAGNFPDATDVIQAAVDQGAMPLRLPAGTFHLSRTIRVDLQNSGWFSIEGGGTTRIVMHGKGPAIHIVGTHRGTAAPETVQPEVWLRQRGPQINGLEIVGNHPEADAIRAEGTMQLTLTRLLVRNGRHAIHLVQRNRNVIVSDCHFYHNHGVGLFLDDVDLHQINVANSHISYNHQGGIVSRGGNVRNLQITGCDLESNMHADQPATANVLIDCSTSLSGTAEVAITGCTVQHNSKGPLSANIRIIGRGLAMEKQPGRQWGHVTITGNVLSDTHTNLHLRQCRGVTLQGNTLWMGYEHNLLVEDCSHLVMAANNFDRNPSYAYGTAATTKNAIVFQGVYDSTLTGMHVAAVQAPAAVQFRKCRRLNVSALTILDRQGVGLLLQEVRDSLFTGCLIDAAGVTEPATPAIQIQGGQGNRFFGNHFQVDEFQDAAAAGQP